MIFGFFYAQAADIPVSPDMTTLIYLLVGASTIVHGLQFGILSKAGLHGFPENIRIINRAIRLKPDVHVDSGLKEREYLSLLKALNHLPRINSVTSFLHVFVIFVCLLLYGVLYENYRGSVLGSGIILFVIIAYIHSVFSYVIGESATGKIRSQCKKIMFSKGIEYSEAPAFSLRLKFVFFILLYAIGLYVAISLTYFTRDNPESVTVFAFFSIAISILMAQWIFNLIYESVKEISEAVDRIKNGGQAKLFPRALDSEFNKLALGVIDASNRLQDYQANMEKKVASRTIELEAAYRELERKDTEMRTELEFAAEIQKGIIPPARVTVGDLEIVSYLQAMEAVSGDYFDIFPLNDDSLGLLIADVSGHGIPAALITTMAKVAFTQACYESSNPAEIFRKVNDRLTGMIDTQDYLTGFYITFEAEEQILFGNAAHQKPFLLKSRTSTIEELDTPGLFIGALQDASDSYQFKRATFEQGDKIILFTDGITERKDRQGNYYTADRLKKNVIEYGKSSCEDLLAYLVKDIEDYSTGTRPVDDSCLVIVERQYRVT